MFAARNGLMRYFHVPILLAGIGLTACQEIDPPAVEALQMPTTGAWHMELDLDSTEAQVILPFQFDLAHQDGHWSLSIHNQDETIVVDSVSIHGDSVLVRMPFFDSEFRGLIQDSSHFHGLWYNYYKGPGYAIPFHASLGRRPRFPGPAAQAPMDISGDWEVHFLDGDNNEPAIGIFTVQDSRVKGSFATQSGDLRYLEGITTHDSLFLSTFNGFQAYLFRAALRNDSMVGEFRNGHRWTQAWYAVRNPAFRLANDETLTTLDPAHPVAFSFPGLDGELHALSDERYRGKAVVVEIMGTWCPNCMDQSRMLDELYHKYHKDGLEAVAVAFERYPDPMRALAAMRHFKAQLGIQYDLLYGGMAKRDTIAKNLPFIRELMSYPTTLLIGRDGTVRHIYTGIHGPGTGARYIRFRERMESAIVELLKEPGAG